MNKPAPTGSGLAREADLPSIPRDSGFANPVRLVPEIGLEHPPACGERIPSPHASCQAALDPFLGAERFPHTRGGPTIVCNRCGAWWREVAA